MPQRPGCGQTTRFDKQRDLKINLALAAITQAIPDLEIARAASAELAKLKDEELGEDAVAVLYAYLKSRLSKDEPVPGCVRAGARLRRRGWRAWSDCCPTGSGRPPVPHWQGGCRRSGSNRVTADAGAAAGGGDPGISRVLRGHGGVRLESQAGPMAR